MTNINKLSCEEDRAKILERSKKYYYSKRDEILIDRSKYYEANKEKILNRSKNYFKSYYEANKEKIINNSINYVKELKKTMTEEERIAKSERDKGYRLKSNIKLNKFSYYEPKIKKETKKKETKKKENIKELETIMIIKINPIIDFDD